VRDTHLYKLFREFPKSLRGHNELLDATAPVREGSDILHARLSRVADDGTSCEISEGSRLPVYQPEEGLDRFAYKLFLILP